VSPPGLRIAHSAVNRCRRFVRDRRCVVHPRTLAHGPARLT